MQLRHRYSDSDSVESKGRDWSEGDSLSHDSPNCFKSKPYCGNWQGEAQLTYTKKNKQRGYIMKEGRELRHCCNVFNYVQSGFEGIFQLLHRYCWYVTNYVQSSFEWILQLFHRYISPGRRSPSLLGFFLQPHFQVCADSIHGLESLPPTQFLCTSDEGKDLKEGNWGALDASLSFLGQAVFIVCSSNGFLLCSTELCPQKHYCVCNPVTKEWRILPKPHKIYEYVALAFICEGNHTSLDDVYYKIVRAGVSNPRELSTMLEIETFSSETGEWKESTLICASPFTLVVANVPAFVVDDVIYWKDPRCLLLAYNPTNESVELMDLPGDAQNFICWSDLFSQSEGKIYYARNDSSYLEIWVLKNYKKALWVMNHKLSLAMMIQHNPEISRTGVKLGRLVICAFHPYDSRRILLNWHGKPFWYNLESGKLDRIADCCSYKHLCNYFLYEWPFVPSVSH